MKEPETRQNLNDPVLGIVAGSGNYPLVLARAARAAGVARLVVAAFENETDPALAALVDEIAWMRVGQLGRMLSFFQKQRRPPRDHGRADRAEKPLRPAARLQGAPAPRHACASATPRAFSARWPTR